MEQVPIETFEELPGFLQRLNVFAGKLVAVGVFLSVALRVQSRIWH